MLNQPEKSMQIGSAPVRLRLGMNRAREVPGTECASDSGKAWRENGKAQQQTDSSRAPCVPCSESHYFVNLNVHRAR